MLRQRCKLKMTEGHYLWIMSIGLDGEIVFTDKEEKALILLNHHWSEFIKRQDLVDYMPHLIDVV